MSRAIHRRKEIRLHGHPVSYYEAGSGPVLLLVHGITSSADAWRSVLPALARHFTVVAPDLMGHGGSAKPRGDYSLGAYASGLRDLLAALGHERATVVGHSMGGGIAMSHGLPVPRARGAARAGLERRPRQGGRPRPARGDAAGRGIVLPVLTRRGPRDVVSAVGAGAQPARPAARAPTCAAPPSASPPCASPPPAARSSTPRARSSTPPASASAPSDSLYLAAGMPTLLSLGRPRPDDPPCARDRRPRGHPPEPPRDLPGRRPLSRSRTTRGASAEGCCETSSA